MVVTQSTEDFPLRRERPVGLGKGIGRMLHVRLTTKLIAHKIVAQIVATDSEGKSLVGGEKMGDVVRKKGARGVLHVAIIAEVFLCGQNEVGLVVLVKVVRQFKPRLWRESPFRLSSSHEVAVAIGLQSILVLLAKEIACARRQAEML